MKGKTKSTAPGPSMTDGAGRGDTDYGRIFHPRQVAVAGVSTEGVFSYGGSLVLSLQAMGYEGRIFPVNPKGGNFSGLKIFRRIEDIPGDIDLAVIAVGAAAVPKTLEACRKKGAAGAEIISSGFSETGTPEGRALEKEIREIAARGIRVIGPNCFGIYCPGSGLTFLPNPDLSRRSGPVAFLSQSGGMASDFANMGKWMGVRFSKVVSFGNGADLRETELLRYLREDGETGVIALYVEGVENGEDFFTALREAARKKPVVVLKGGLSRAGGRALISHTASLGGDRVIWKSILKQAGAVQVEDLNEMAQACLAFSMLPTRACKGVSVIGGGGALGIAACDFAESFGIDIPSFPEDLKKNIENLLPRSGASAANPVDVANPYTPPETVNRILRLAAGDDRIDLQIMIFLFHHFRQIARTAGRPVGETIPFREFAEALEDGAKETGKPVVAVLSNAKRGLEDLDLVETTEKARQAFLDRGVPVFEETRDALRALAHVNAYYTRHGQGWDE